MPWPFVARDAELAAALAAVDAGGSVVIYGDGGGGKTRLATEVIDHLRGRGHVVARVSATEASRSLPLGALAPLLPELGPGEANALAAARAAIAERAGGGRLALMVDDAHLLDDASATMVLQIAVQRLASVVLTVHRWRPVPDAVTALWKEGVAERLDLAPLGVGQVADAVAARLGGPVEVSAVEQLHRFSEGLPLALTELVEGSLSSGVLHEEAGRWVLDDVPLPSVRLVDLVERRIDLLDDAGRRGLELLTFGEPLDLDVFESLVGSESADTLEWRSFAVVRDDSGRPQVWLAHPLHGSVVRRRTGLATRRALLRALADAVGATASPSPSDQARVAVWRLDAGSTPGTAGLVTAARQATVARDLAAVERLAGVAWTRDRDVEAGYLLGTARLRRGDPAGAAEVLAAAASSAEPRWQAELAAAHAEALFRLGRASEAIARCEEAEAVAPRDAAGRLAALRAFYVLATGDAEVAFGIVEPLLASGDERMVGAAAPSAIPALIALGRADDAVALAERAVAAHDAAWSAGEALLDPDATRLAVAAAHLSAGRLDVAEALADDAHRRASALHLQQITGVAALLVGTVALRRGRAVTAAAWCARAARLLRDADASGRAAHALSLLALAEAQRGDLDAARRALAEGRDVFVPAVWTAGFREAEAVLVAAGGNERDAIEHLAASARDALADHQVELAAHRAFALAMLGAPDRAEVMARSLRGRVQGGLLPALLEAVAAMADGDATRLDDITDRLEASGHLGWAADTAAAAAAAARAAGLTRPATAAAQRAVALLGRCEGIVPHWLLQGTTVEPLSPRERDVAELAADGLSNTEIAAKLYLSTRTVENHLYRAYAKLGVSGRAELADRLGRG